MLPTSAAVLEILIIGIQAMGWVGLALGALLGGGKLWLQIFQLPDGLVVAAVGLVAYGLGVVVDRVADNLVAPWRSELKGAFPPIPIMRLRMMQLDDGRSRFLEYQRSRLRIARATTANLFLLALTSTWFMWVQTELRALQIIGVEIVVVLLLVSAFSGAQLIGQAYDRRLGEAYSMWARENREAALLERGVKLIKLKKKRKKNGAHESCVRAAAVCYRMNRGEPIFYLVETDDGERWTFPKGRLKKKETPERAAAREAKEEAGVRGKVERELTTYRYPAGGSKWCPEVNVTAFLLPIKKDPGRQARGDRHRERDWFPPDKAKEKLTFGRVPPYSTEHERVIDEAVLILTT
jgi:8-oxo-dGTP pyrophosphatase MutT (NUDIX family)